MKKSLSILLISIVSFLILYLSSTFIMKDKNEIWCMFTWGTFKPVMITKNAGLNATLTDEFICLGGIFDIRKNKRNLRYEKSESSQYLPEGWGSFLNSEEK